MCKARRRCYRQLRRAFLYHPTPSRLLIQLCDCIAFGFSLPRLLDLASLLCRSWDTNYSIANGGKWAFSDSTDHSKYVVPLEQGFWDWLLSKSKAWGLATYEQDWLYNEFNNVVSKNG